MNFKYSFFIHPSSVCMSYFEHMVLSLGFAFTFFMGALKAIVHAFIPSLFITSTSDLIKDIDHSLKTKGCHDEN